jgi:hypothetical protein
MQQHRLPGDSDFVVTPRLVIFGTGHRLVAVVADAIALQLVTAEAFVAALDPAV